MRVIPPNPLRWRCDSEEGKGTSAPSATQEEPSVFFARGRDAIFYASKALHLKPGDVVLAPALICSSAIEPLRARRLKVRLVEVTRDLEYDLTALRDALGKHSPKAMLAVCFFGFTP